MDITRKRIINPQRYLYALHPGDKFYIAVPLAEEDYPRLQFYGLLPDSPARIPIPRRAATTLNANGKWKVLRDLPKEKRSFEHDYHIVDWHGNVQAAGKAGKKFIPVSFPDGRTGFLKHDECRELSEWASTPVNMNKIIQTAKGMMGTTYLWGGTSVKSADCSGFVKTAYFSAGIILSRDASQQALTGDIMPAEQWDECQTGDLLFFGNAPGKVSHVALYLNDGKYIHSSGQVKINSIDSADTDYYAIPLLGISRVVNKIGTPGITAVKRHPWYFEQK